MDLPSAIAAMGGLMVAALSLWLNYKSRSSVHREYFYQKQIDAFVAIMNALNPLHNACQDFIVLNGFRLNSETRLKFRLAISRGELSAFYREFSLQHQTWALFLPSYMQEQISGFIKTLSAISAPDDVANQYPPNLVNSKDPGLELSKAYSGVVSAARRGLGVEPLSQEILKLLGEAKPPEAEKKLKKAG
ncbi:MAG TPA: hypothetical protein VGX48_13665 [Pyrinomonadaceae bacterium]|jgi:hypothetical protein|nr:hypothetical protein [Pyrinomonadaceae bacterium]